MTNLFEFPDTNDLLLLVTALVAYAFYWLVLRKHVKSYFRRGDDESGPNIGT